MDLKALQKEVDDYISQFKEGYWPPHENLVRLMEEVGELAREVSHLHGSKKKKADEKPSSTEEELGDILFCVACLANQLNVDLSAAFQKTMQKYSTRDKNRYERK